MASFEQHVTQAKSNLKFLKQVTDGSTFYDWQVTTCFYAAVHLVNAHIAKVSDAHYRSHEKTKLAINPHNSSAVQPFDADVHDDYVSLEKLSRRSRYFCNPEGDAAMDKIASITKIKHVKKAMVQLNSVMTYFKDIHGIDFDAIEITCPNLKPEIPAALSYFKLAEAAV